MKAFKVTWTRYGLSIGSFAVGGLSNENYSKTSSERLFSTKEKAQEFAKKIDEANHVLGQQGFATISEYEIE